MTAVERLRMLMAGRLARQAALAHGSAVAESGVGFHRSTRRRMHFVAPSRNYEACHAGEWNCSIPEDAPIWVACRKGPTLVWKAGKEPRDE